MKIENGIDSYKPVYHALTEKIAGRICDGSYTDKIPSTNSLAEEFKVNFKTVQHAVSVLAENGVVESRRGSGTQILPNGKNKAMTLMPSSFYTSNHIVFVIPSGPHVYGKLYSSIISHLNDRFYFPILLNSDDNCEAMLRKTLDMKPSFLVLDREWNQVPFGIFEQIDETETQVIFLNRAEFDAPVKGHYVLSDSFMGAYKATKHLIDLGHERILHLTYPMHQPSPSPAVYRHTIRSQMISGYRFALEEAGLSANEAILCQAGDAEQDQQEFRALFIDGNTRPTAVFASDDFRIMDCYKVIDDLNLSVPDDLALIGYYDTPHCQYARVSLSSVSIREEDLGTSAAEIITGGKQAYRDIKIQPRLVIRESCGGKQNHTI